MKKILLSLIMLVGLFAYQATAQRSIVVMNNVDIGDSTIVNFDVSKDVHKWSSFYVEALYTGLTVNDTIAAVEIYNVINNNFTDATDLVPTETISGSPVSQLRASDANGGTGTIMKSATITNSQLQHVRFVCDPDPTDSGAGKLTLRIVPTYKSAYTPPN